MPWFNFSFQNFAFSFLSVLFEGVPFLLLGSLISGIVDVWVSSERLARWLPKNASAAIWLSGLLGFIFPMCECGSVVVIRRFLRKGLPLSCAVTYMLSAPIVSPVVALATFAAFKGNNPETMTIARVALGYLIAVGVGFVVRLFSAQQLLQPKLLADLPNQRSGFRVAAAPAAPGVERDFADSGEVKQMSFGRKLLLALQSATADFLDVATFLVIGTAITSVFNTALNQAVIAPLATSTPVAIAALMTLAALLAICSTSDAFIAATFTQFPQAAKLAFMLFGPMFDLKLFWMYGIIFRRGPIAFLGLGLFVVIGLICWKIAPILT